MKPKNGALIACCDEYGILLDWYGGHMNSRVEEYGIETHELGFDHNEVFDGVCIWEGDLLFESDEEDIDFIYFKGEFRKLTNDEWDKFRKSGGVFEAEMSEKNKIEFNEETENILNPSDEENKIEDCIDELEKTEI